MFTLIKHLLEDYKRIRTGRVAAKELVKTLNLSQMMLILELESKGEFYCSKHRRLGHALHGHYLATYSVIFPELYWESSDKVSSAIWKYFTKQLRIAISH